MIPKIPNVRKLLLQYSLRVCELSTRNRRIDWYLRVSFSFPLCHLFEFVALSFANNDRTKIIFLRRPDSNHYFKDCVELEIYSLIFNFQHMIEVSQSQGIFCVFQRLLKDFLLKIKTTTSSMLSGHLHPSQVYTP